MESKKGVDGRVTLNEKVMGNARRIAYYMTV